MSDAVVVPDDLAAQTTEAARKHVGVVVGCRRGAAVSIRGSGQVRGDGSPDDHVPGGETIFQIGSITKVFTALLLADAVTRGEVTLDEPVAELLPGVTVPQRGRAITLGDLASHTSGLPRLPKGLLRQGLRNRRDPYANFTTLDLIAALATTRLKREPGAKVRYSNFGAALLGEALSRRIGQSYESLVQSRICTPLELVDTRIDPPPDAEPRMAMGHSHRGKPVPDWHLPSMPGAGALRSTASDLLILLRHHLSPAQSPLPDAIAMVQAPRVRAGRFVRVGLGWHLSPLRGTDETMVWHNGGAGGFFSFAGFVPGENAAVVMLSNTARPVDRLAIRLLRRLVTSS
jgi:serine-type D-Ala-D-Ala carboxypeptidase/endopeptidase